MTISDRYYCESCDPEQQQPFDFLSHPSIEASPPVCPVCGETETVKQKIGNTNMKVIVRGNSDYAERERARLTKRSNEHFQKKGREEGIERQRMQLKREGYVQ